MEGAVFSNFFQEINLDRSVSSGIIHNAFSGIAWSHPIVSSLCSPSRRYERVPKLKWAARCRGIRGISSLILAASRPAQLAAGLFRDDGNSYTRTTMTTTTIPHRDPSTKNSFRALANFIDIAQALYEYTEWPRNVAVKVIWRISCTHESLREAKFIGYIKYDIPEITQPNSNGFAIVAKMWQTKFYCPQITFKSWIFKIDIYKLHLELHSFCVKSFLKLISINTFQNKSKFYF